MTCFPDPVPSIDSRTSYPPIFPRLPRSVGKPRLLVGITLFVSVLRALTPMAALPLQATPFTRSPSPLSISWQLNRQVSAVFIPHSHLHQDVLLPQVPPPVSHPPPLPHKVVGFVVPGSPTPPFIQRVVLSTVCPPPAPYTPGGLAVTRAAPGFRAASSSVEIMMMKPSRQRQDLVQDAGARRNSNRRNTVIFLLTPTLCSLSPLPLHARRLFCCCLRHLSAEPVRVPACFAARVDDQRAKVVRDNGEHFATSTALRIDRLSYGVAVQLGGAVESRDGIVG